MTAPMNPTLGHRPRRHARTAIAALGLFAALAGCSSKVTSPPGPTATPRSFFMGFAGIPPRPDLLQAIAAIDLWSQRADAALMSEELPWDSLLAGRPPDSLVIRHQLALAQYYRAKGLRLVVMIDPANGLNRGAESDQLVAAGRSITEPAIQLLYRRYAVAMDSLLNPDELGLALETNLIRAVSPAPLYAAIRQAVNDAAADVRARNATVPLMVSVQVETAWGLLPVTGSYVGVAQDFTDFPFVQVLGLSSYPYFAGFGEPENVPIDYYARIVQGRTIPVIITEGGWTSATVAGIPSTPAAQRRYLIRQAQLLDQVSAAGVFQLTFTDLDLAVWPASITPFAYLGLVDPDLVPKPALAPWDSVFARPRL